MSTPELHQRLERLNDAIQSGEKVVTEANGASVTYRSLDEMKDARRDIEARLAPASRRRRAVVVRASFGTLRGG